MTTIEHSAFASPLSLLNQWRDLVEGPRLRELVVLGFTLDLAFLERFAVPVARQLGARVTVVADARQQLHDPVDVRFAGRSYQHGLVALPGAFHPKLAVLLGDEQVWFAIGSGNPTTAGWGHNHELWFVLRGDIARGPQVQADLGTWLQRLPEYVPMPSWIGTTLADVGRRIGPAAVDGSLADVRLVHNLDAPVVDGLPDLAATELHLAAPFLDPSGRAVRELINRATPAKVCIALQRDLSSFSGRALVDATAGVPAVEFRDVDARRTLHGKLIEWIDVEGRTTAVVGSPNLTGAALLGMIRDGHSNCELAVAAPVAESLLPEATPMPTAEVAIRGWNRPDIPGPGPGLHLLGCLITPDGLVVELRSRHAVEVTVETSPDGSPGSWERKAVIPASVVRPSATTTWSVDAPEVVGGAVRIVATLDGRRVESSAAFVTDARRCSPRTDVGDAPRLRREYDIDELITDEALAARFSQDLLRLLEESARARATGVRPASTATAGAQAGIDRWQRFLDFVAHSVGGPLAELTFPGALPAPTATAHSSSWSVADVADETELTDGETESEIEDLDITITRAPRRIPRERHERYRGWMRRWVDAIGPRQGRAVPALPLRMTVAAVYTDLLAAGVWGTNGGWRAQLADVVSALATDLPERADAPQESRPYLGSRVAVCLALLLQDAKLHGGSPTDVTARRAWEAGHPLAALADPGLVESILLTSQESHARIATPTEVAAVATLAREALADPFAEALDGLAAEGFEIERREALWIVRGSFRNTLRAAARLVTDLAKPSGVTAVAISGSRSTVMVRRSDTLLVGDSANRQWRTSTVRPPATPASMFAGGDGLPPARISRPLLPVPSEVLDLGRDAGCDLAKIAAEFLAPTARPQPRSKALDVDW